MDGSSAVTRNHPFLPPAALAIACLAWGSAFYFGKIALVELDPLGVTGLRFAISAPVFALIVLRFGRRLSLKDAALVVVTGILCVPVGYLVHFEGLDRTSATHAALLVGTGTPMLALAAWGLRIERLRSRDWLAIGLSVVGVVVMVGLPGGGGDLVGDALVLLSMVIATAWVLLSQGLARRLGAAVATGWILLAGTAALVPAFAVTGPPSLDLSPGTWMALLALGLGCTAGSFLLWNWGASVLPAGRAGVFLNLEPVSGVLLGVWLLGESAGVPVVLGGAIVLGAALLASLGGQGGEQTIAKAGEQAGAELGEAAERPADVPARGFPYITIAPDIGSSTP